nr:hypothetical protein [Vibrio lentus]PMI64270.1 hypothetical protein BCU43_25265 [Vibrio lentus]
MASTQSLTATEAHTIKKAQDIKFENCLTNALLTLRLENGARERLNGVYTSLVNDLSVILDLESEVRPINANELALEVISVCAAKN